MKVSPLYKILIVCAMNEESNHMVKELKNHDIEYNTGYYSDRNTEKPDIQVDILTTGIGMVNAAIKTTEFLAKERPDIIINVGCAGAHDETLNLGDVVIGEKCLSTSNLIIDRKNDIHHYGMRCSSTNTDCIKQWNADSDLLNFINYEKYDELKTYKDDNKSIVKHGVIGSSDIWLDNIPRVKWSQNFFGTDCEEMEAASIAQVAYLHEIPFMAIKDISNSVYRSSDFEGISHDVPCFAGKNSAIVAAKLCKQLINKINKKINYIL